MARKTIVIGSFVAIVLVGSAALELRGGQQTKGEEPSRWIPLESVYGTNGQKGLKKPEQDMADVFRGADKVGASNVFLVRGRDIEAALKVTRIAFGGDDCRASVGPDYEARPKEHWIVAYFGVAGNDPPDVVVESVQQNGNIIRFNFARKEQRGTSKDRRLFCFWAPLGALRDGAYTLELFDLTSHEVVFLRRMRVESMELPAVE